MVLTESGGGLGNALVGRTLIATKTERWEALCEEHAQAMSTWRDIFARNCAGMAAVALSS